MATYTDASRAGLLSPREFADDVRALSALINLKLLDRYWTREAGRPAGQRASLTPVVDEMTRLIDEIAALAPRVAAISEKYATELQPAFDEVVQRRPDINDRVQQQSGGEIAASATRAAEALTQGASAEIEHLRAENRRLEAEQFSAGDLTADFDGSLDILGLHLEAHLHVEIDVEGEDLVGIVGGLLGAIFG